MDASQLPHGQSTESNGDKRPVNLPGIYENKKSKKQIITSEGDEGIVQADALMQPRWQNAWERVGDVPSRIELLEMQKAQAMKDKTAAAREKKAEKAQLAEAVK